MSNSQVIHSNLWKNQYSKREERELAINLNKLRSYLENERKRLLEGLNQIEVDVQPQEVRREGSPFGKREEEATESFELEKRLALRRQLTDQLAVIEHALQKFAQGTYGLCDACNQPIDPDRLEALPQANLCLPCKGKAKVR